MKMPSLPSKTTLLLNGAAILVGVASLAVVVRSVFVTDDPPGCRERYQTTMRLALDKQGTALAPEELQARLGSSEWGLRDAARVVKLKSGPATFALELNLGTARERAAESHTEVRPGIGFVWAPAGLNGASTACLSYGLFVSEGFSFGREARLPGLQGGLATDQGGEPTFSTRYAVAPSGDASINMHLAGQTGGRPFNNDRRGFKLEAGRWMQFEQEVVLNAPGKSDGLLRVWQDGRLVFQKTNVVFRSGAAEHITGVLAEFVGGAPPTGQKSGPQVLWITPFEVRWER